MVPAPFCDGVRCGKCVSWAKVASGENDCFSLQDKILLSHSMREEACQKNSSLCSKFLPFFLYISVKFYVHGMFMLYINHQKEQCK